MKPDMPRVSVLMPAYNAARYISAAIESVLAQSYGNFEFIIVDDGSTDETGKIVDSFASRAKQIHVLRNDCNRGLIATLNIGLAEAGGEFIARIDADDLCRGDRLAKQVSFLERNSDHTLVSSSYNAIDESGRVLWRKVTGFDDAQVRWVARFRTPLAHSGAMFRRVNPSGHAWRYDEQFEATEDYDLWLRMLETGRAAVLPQTLFNYRYHHHAITEEIGPTMAQNTLKIALRNAQSNFPDVMFERFSVFLRAYLTRQKLDRDGVIGSVSAFDDMLRGDIAVFPQHRWWFRKQAAGVLAQGILERGGVAHDWRLLRTFVLASARYIPWFIARAVEDRGSSIALMRRRPFGQ
jgi:glycosyltransferase involved in cell wall biosynthesis